MGHNSVEASGRGFRSRTIADRILDDVGKVAPAYGETLHFESEHNGTFRHRPVRQGSGESIECFREEPMGPESVELHRTVTGVDSESHRLRIRLNGPCTEQAVDYGPDPEGRTLCQAFNERQKLRCSAVFSPSRAIERILRIDAASALELCAITVGPFQVDVGTIHLKEPLRIREQLGTAAESTVHVEYPDPNLLVFAEFQETLLNQF